MRRVFGIALLLVLAAGVEQAFAPTDCSTPFCEECYWRPRGYFVCRVTNYDQFCDCQLMSDGTCQTFNFCDYTPPIP